jgi:putative DNA primase/helicase
MNEDIIVTAKGKWMSILLSLGFTEQAVSGKHGPCPMCEGTDRFRMIEKAGNGKWICNQCGSGDTMNLIMETLGLSFQDAAERIRPYIGGASYSEYPKKPNNAEEKRQLIKLMDLWREAEDRESVKKYLCARGLSPKAFAMADIRGRELHHYDENMKKTENVPAMIARVINPQNKTVALHRTYFLPGGREKKITKTVGTINGGAIRLFSVKDKETLIVSEGIETALAARWLWIESGHDPDPCWATISAVGMKNLAVPKMIKKVIIMGDNDASYTGQHAAYELANRLVVREKREVEVYFPKFADEDWLDVVVRKNKQGE